MISKGTSASSGNACIVVGEEARQMLQQRGVCVRLKVLVDLLRRTGTPEHALQSLAVAIWANDTAVSDRGGVFQGDAILTYTNNDATCVQTFAPVIHIDVRARRNLNFIVLHEAGHVRAHAKGKLGVALYGRGYELWVRVIAFAVSCMAFVLAFSGYHEAWFILGAGGQLAMMFADRLLWYLSPTELKANWFAWRHRKVDVVGTEPDGTVVLFSHRGSINGKKVVGDQ